MKIKIPALIRDFAPRWTKNMESRRTTTALRQGITVDGEFIKMSEWDRCIVGEVNCFTQEYQGGKGKCITCKRYASEFHNYIDRGDKDSLESQLKSYEKHINRKHIDQIKAKKLAIEDMDNED